MESREYKESLEQRRTASSVAATTTARIPGQGVETRGYSGLKGSKFRRGVAEEGPVQRVLSFGGVDPRYGARWKGSTQRDSVSRDLDHRQGSRFGGSFRSGADDVGGGCVPSCSGERGSDRDSIIFSGGKGSEPSYELEDGLRNWLADDRHGDGALDYRHRQQVSSPKLLLPTQMFSFLVLRCFTIMLRVCLQHGDSAFFP